jgi:uncharacterized protein with GYD domain
MKRYAASWMVGAHRAVIIVEADAISDAREYAQSLGATGATVRAATVSDMREHDECGGRLHRAGSEQYSLLPATNTAVGGVA